MPLAEFRVVHLSDLHLGVIPAMRGLHHRKLYRWMQLADALGQLKDTKLDITSITGTYDPMAASALLATLEASHLNEVDAILLTGDVVSVGRLADLQMARNYLLAGKNELGVALPANKLVAMPGNHDRFFAALPLLSGSEHFEDVTAFDRKWSPGMETVIHPTPVRERRLYTRDKKPGLSVICADFALTKTSSSSRALSFVRHLNEGVVSDAVLHALKVLTTTAKEEGFAVVWAIHYPPDFPRQRWRQELRGYKGLLKEAKASEVQHIFSGHTHEQKVYETASARNIWVHCAGSPTCDGSTDFEFMKHKIGVLAGEVLYVDTAMYRRVRDPSNKLGMAKYGVFKRFRTQTVSH